MALSSFMIALLLGCTLLRAQRSEPPESIEAGLGSPIRQIDTTTLLWADLRPDDELLPKLAADPDTAIIVPGSRDVLEPNIPNPFGELRRQTDIAYSLAAESPVELRVYDFFYNEVVTLVAGEVQSAGRHVVPFDPPPTMPSGMYFYELKTPRYRELRRMIYIK